MTLQAGSQTLSQTISLATIQSTGTVMVPFNVAFGAVDIGVQTITATIDPGNALSENTFTNNTTSVQVNVAAPYQIVATVNGSQVYPSQKEFSLPPTQLADPDCSAELLPYIPQSLPITLHCLNVVTGLPADGCSYSLTLVSGPNRAGHLHGGVQPYACLPTECPDIANLLVQGQTGPIAYSGTSLTYAAPEVSGDVVLNFAGTDPNGQVIAADNLPPPIEFHVQVEGSKNWVPLSTDDVDVIINGADLNPSHPTGFYGTLDMATAVTSLGESFYSSLSPTETPPLIYSQAGSLPWGGI